MRRHSSDVAERDTWLGYKCEPNRSGAELRHTSSVRYTNMTAVNARFLSGRQNSATRQSCRRIHLNPHEIQVLSGDCYRIASPVPQANRGPTRELALNRRSSHLQCPPMSPATSIELKRRSAVFSPPVRVASRKPKLAKRTPKASNLQPNPLIRQGW